MIYEKSKTSKISFPLGGIGSGCIGLSGDGQLVEWEIFNRPSKATRNGYSHFAIKARRSNGSVTRVLQGDTNENLMGTHTRQLHMGYGYGPRTYSMAGFPHFKDLRFEGTFPVAKLTFRDEGFPATVRLTAFNPFIPHDDLNSSLPAAFFEWEIENTTQEDIEYSIALSARNPADCSVNSGVEREDVQGLFMKHGGVGEDQIGYCDLCMLAEGGEIVVEDYWYRGEWQDGVTMFWKNFSEMDRLPKRSYSPEERKGFDHGAVASYITVAAGQKKKIRFVLAWNVPNQYNYWAPCKDENGNHPTWKNYYATKFATSEDTAAYAMKNFSELYAKTQTFTDVLQSSTLPPYVIDAISANLSVLKSPVPFRLQDGSMWGWEAAAEDEGSCDGSCQHVWNYAYSLPFLFPKLEQSLRVNTIDHSRLPNGKTRFRVPLPLGRDLGWFRACVDGQMGEVIKCYREWKISGDTEWLKKHSEGIFTMLEWAWSKENEDAWDADMDGVLEGRQHQTLDMELFGPSSWLEGFYLLALDCGAKMAEAVGERDRAALYRGLYEKGKAWANEHLFNGEYFQQKIDLGDKSIIDRFGAYHYWNAEAGQIKYQIDRGCMIDQMLADWHGAIIGSADVFDVDKKRTALESIYKYNYKTQMREVTNMWRNFALNDEGGTMICAYPEGVTPPAIPIPYCEEAWTGMEYAIAGLMISQGLVEQGETVVRTTRARYDGENRNPWSELECGSNYVRSMSSYALLPIYSGFTFDMTEKYMGFSPVRKGDGQYLWSVGNTWGNVEFLGGSCKLSVLGEPLSLNSLGLDDAQRITGVRVDGKEVSFTVENGRVRLSDACIHRTLELIRT